MSLRRRLLFTDRSGAARGPFRRGPACSRRRRWDAWPSFSGLARCELERLARMTEDIDLQAGKILLREGGTAHQFFLIVEGEAEVTKGGKFVRRLDPGCFFGETG